MTERLKHAWTMLREAIDGFNRDRAAHLSAAMAFYAIFSVAPLLLIATAVGGLVFGQEAARSQIVLQIQQLVGPEAGAFIVRLLENWRNEEAGLVATAVGTTTTLYLAFRVFDALRDTLDAVWNVRLRPDITWGRLGLKYLKSFAVMFLVGPMFVVSVIISEVLTRMGPWLTERGSWMVGFSMLPSALISFVILTVMFAIIYKWLPDVEIAWRDVLFGSLLTAVLFSLGRALIAFYLARATTASLFGAAGSLVLLLFWAYYSAHILYFGAEVTEVYANRSGRGIHPDRDAMRVEIRSRDAGEEATSSEG
jgi:membrane protein